MTTPTNPINTAKTQLKAVKDAIALQEKMIAEVAALPPVTQFNTRFWIFYSGKKADGKKFDLPLWEIPTMTLGKNDALAKLLTNQPSDKICWENLPEVASFMTSNMLDAKYTLRIGSKHATTADAKEFPVYMEIVKSGVFSRMELIAASINASSQAIKDNSASFNLVNKHPKRGNATTTTTEALPEGLFL